MLNLVGAIAGMIAISVNLVGFTSVLPGTLRLRLSAAALQGPGLGWQRSLGRLTGWPSLQSIRCRS